MKKVSKKQFLTSHRLINITKISSKNGKNTHALEFYEVLLLDATTTTSGGDIVKLLKTNVNTNIVKLLKTNVGKNSRDFVKFILRVIIDGSYNR